MAGILDAAGLPALPATVMKPWVTAVETGTLGMREVVTSTASSTTASLKRRVVILPALDKAITAAVGASVAFGEALDKRDVKVAKHRATALAALEVVIQLLRTAEPSEDARTLGLGW